MVKQTDLIILLLLAVSTGADNDGDVNSKSSSKNVDHIVKKAPAILKKLEPSLKEIEKLINDHGEGESDDLHAKWGRSMFTAVAHHAVRGKGDSDDHEGADYSDNTEGQLIKKAPSILNKMKPEIIEIEKWMTAGEIEVPDDVHTKWGKSLTAAVAPHFNAKNQERKKKMH